MNWYKQSQKMPTMEDIIWAIDKIIAEQYDFSVEELQQASDPINNSQQWEQKAAQSLRGGMDEAVLNLFEKAFSTRDIANELGIDSKEVGKILKKYFPSKAYRDEYISDKHDQNIVDTYQEQADVMEEDFNIYGVTTKSIAETLDIHPRYVGRVIVYNGIKLQILSKKRADKIARYITEIVKDLPGKFKMKDIMREFYERHNFKLKDRSAFSAVKLLNLGDKAQNDPATIFMAFTTYIYNHQQGGVKALAFLPDKIPILIDGFFDEYGQNHGFLPPISKEELQKMLMTKIQMRERTEENAQNRQNPNRYNPIVTDESHPSYFLTNQQPQLAKGEMNWYKKARRVPGGLADKKKPSDFNPKQIEKGLEVELEHTDDRDLSKDIAMDHLEEFPTYYTELDKMEKNLEEKKPARRGRYQGQLQGDENRPDSQVMDDIIRDNEIVEGPHVKILHNMAVNKNWDGFNAYVQKLKDEGHKQTRIDSMMTRAMYRVKL